MRQLMEEGPRAVNHVFSRELRVDGKPHRAYSLVDSCAEGEPGIILEATVPGHLSDEYYRADVELDAVVEDVVMPAFRGEIVILGPDGPNTKIVAATADYFGSGGGNEDSAVKLGQETEYANRRPSDVAYEVSARLPYRGIRIENVHEPLFSRTVSRGDQFPENTTIQAVRDAVRDDSGLFCYGDEQNVCRGVHTSRFEEPADPVATYQPAVHFRQGSGSQSGTGFEAPLRDENRYRDLVIMTEGGETGDGSLVRLSGARAVEVPYRKGIKAPPEGTTRYIQTDDQDTGKAKTLALTTALAAARGVHGFTLPILMIDPRIQRVDTLAWTTRERETPIGAESWSVLREFALEWRGVVAGRVRDWNLRTCTYTGTALVYSREEADVAQSSGLRSGRRSRGLVAS